MAVRTFLGPVWPSGGTRCGGAEGETNPPSRIPRMDPDPSLFGVPDDACGRGGPYRAARPEPEVLRSVRHSLVRTAPPDRGRLVSQAGASKIRRGASVEYPGDGHPPECEATDSRGIGRFRGPVRRSGVCARIDGGRGGAGDSQDERTPAGDPGGSGLRFAYLGEEKKGGGRGAQASSCLSSRAV